jgi:hypothetical protein
MAFFGVQQTDLDKLRDAGLATASGIEGISRTFPEGSYKANGQLRPEAMSEISDTTTRSLLLHRVCAGWGWAVHGTVFDFCDGNRTGRILQNSGADISIHMPSHCRERLRFTAGWRACTCRAAGKAIRGDRIVKVSGHALHTSAPRYLCYDLELQLESGSSIYYSGENAGWRGAPFEFVPSPTSVVRNLIFENGTVAGLVTVQSSLFLALSPQHHHLLPPAIRARVLFILNVFDQINRQRTRRALPTVSNDVWLLILSKFRGLDLAVG